MSYPYFGDVMVQGERPLHDSGDGFQSSVSCARGAPEGVVGSSHETVKIPGFELR